LSPASRWEGIFWAITGTFLVCTALFYFCPPEPRLLRKTVHFLSLEFEQNLATWWEGLCFLIVALLAFERSGKSGPRWAWWGLAALGAGLSLDELSSIHERSDLLFKPIGLDDQSLAVLPFAIPAGVIAVITLAGFWRAGERRRARLLGITLVLLGSVVFQEKIEHRLHLPPGFAPYRGVVEEGSELVGVYLLLQIVVNPGAPIVSLLPEPRTARRLLAPAAVITVLATPVLVYIGWVTRSMQRGRGIPMAWCPFALVAIAGLAALAAAPESKRERGVLTLLGVLALFSCFDEIAVLDLGHNTHLARSALQLFMLPVLGGLAMLVPRIRSVPSGVLLVVLFATGHPLLTSAGRLWPWFVAPIEAFGLLYVVATGLASGGAEPASAVGATR